MPPPSWTDPGHLPPPRVTIPPPICSDPFGPRSYPHRLLIGFRNRRSRCTVGEAGPSGAGGILLWPNMGCVDRILGGDGGEEDGLLSGVICSHSRPHTSVALRKHEQGGIEQVMEGRRVVGGRLGLDGGRMDILVRVHRGKEATLTLHSQIKSFHKISSLLAPVTDSEKHIWNVLKSERPNISQLHDKSLTEVNQAFLEKHREESLMQRVAVAEMLYVLEPDKKLEALKLTEDSTNNLAKPNDVLGPIKEWKLQDCIAVHK